MTDERGARSDVADSKTSRRKRKWMDAQTVVPVLIVLQVLLCSSFVSNVSVSEIVPMTDVVLEMRNSPSLSLPEVPRKKDNKSNKSSNNSNSNNNSNNNNNNNNNDNNESALVLTETDDIYGRPSCWGCSPIVVRSQRLVFFTTPKVACTTFKMLLRRMMGDENWIQQGFNEIHDPRRNRLTYLHHYPLAEANEMMTSPHWTRAIFVRDPKTRALSAYIEKVTNWNGVYVRRMCCRKKALQNTTKEILQCDKEGQADIPKGEVLMTYMEFLDHLVVECWDPHWKSQRKRMETKFWKYINFVGHFETVEADTRRLLQRLPDPQAWEKYGATGWDFMVGGSKKDTTMNTSASVFSPKTKARHSTNSSGQVDMYYSSPEVEARVLELYREDYEFALFNFSQ